MRLKTTGEVKNMQGAVDAALAKFGYTGKKVVVDNRGNFPEDIRKSSPTAEGFTTGDGTLYIDAAKHANHADAIFTAFHEAFHRGELGAEAKPYLDALTKARKNKTVNNVAESIKANFKSRKGKAIPDSLATREALAEIHGATKTGRWDLLKERHGVDVSALEKAASKGAVRDFIAKAKDFFTKKFRGSMSDREINKFVDDIFQKHNEDINKSFRDLVPEENVAHSDTGKSADEVYADKRSRLRDLLDNGLVTHREFWERVKELKAEREGGDDLKGVYHHVAPKEVLNEPIMRTNKDGSVTPHHDVNTDYEGRRIIPRHDVDRVMLSLRKWDMMNFKKSKKMQWLRKEVFPDKSPRQIMEMVNERRNKEGSIYAAVSHERRENNPKYVHVAKTDRDIAFSEYGIRKADLNTPQFKKWFGESKVKDAKGEPQLVYHGTGERFTVFDKSKLGMANEHATSPLGHYFTPDRNLALKYAERASEGRPADQVMVPAYLHVENPHEMTLKQAQAIETPAEAKALRAKLEAQGHDGVKITSPRGDTWVAFDSEQVKSPYNKGEFNPANPDIMHSDFGSKKEDPHLEALRDTLRSQLDKGKITRKEFYDRIKAYKDRSEPLKTKTAQLNEAISKNEPPKYEDLNEPLSTLGKTARAWSYFSMLTSLRTIPRILATSINETAIRPIEEILGVINSKIAPNVAKLAPRYGGGISSKAEGKAFDAIFNGKEYSDMLRTGRTSIDRSMGEILDRYKGKIPKEDWDKIEELANNWKMMASAHTGLLAAPGRIHGALHTMPMLAEYARSTEKRTASIVRQLKESGMTDQQAAYGAMQPLAQLNIQVGAYADALSAAYRGETTVGKYYDKAIKALRDGGGMANAFASLLQIANPFVKVSANLFSRATSFAAGGVKAGVEYAHAKRTGLMTPEQADYIIKNMNAQGVGVAALMLGAVYYKQMGGLYDPKTYNRKDMPETGTIEFGGTKIPAHILEHPMIQLAQLGAMITRGVFEGRGGAAALAGTKDLANIASVVRSSGDLSKALESSNGFMKYLADMVTSRLIPAPVRDVAAMQDYMDNDPSHPRALEALWHYMILNDTIKRRVKTGEDVLRKQLPKTSVNPDFNVQSLDRR